VVFKQYARGMQYKCTIGGVAVQRYACVHFFCRKFQKFLLYL